MIPLSFCQRACARIIALPATVPWGSVACYGTSARPARGMNSLKRSRRLSPHVSAKVIGTKSGRNSSRDVGKPMGRADRSEKPEWSDRPDRSARPEGTTRPDRSTRSDRSGRPERSSRSDRSDRSERFSRFDRSDKPERSARADRSEKSDSRKIETRRPSGRRRLDPNANTTNDPAYMVGPPNSGNFASLKVVKKAERTENQGILSKIDDFAALRIEPGVRQGIMEGVLAHLEYKKPTAIQVLGIKAIQARKRSTEQFRSYLIAAETGSGKTLAYMAPLMSKLKEEELTRKDWDQIKDLPIVRSIILVPTLELVSQVISTVKGISHSAKLSSLALTADISHRGIRDSLKRRIDVLVCTPEKFLQVFKDPNALKGHLKYCRFLTVDEADTLMDETFVEHTQKVIEGVPSIADLVFCSATIPRRFDRIMRKLYPDVERIVAPNIHKIPRHVDFRVIEVFNPPYLNSKPLALQQALYAIHNDNTEPGKVKRTVVFVNSKDALEPIVTTLVEKGYDAVSVSGGMSLDLRKEIVTAFVEPIPLPVNANDVGVSKVKVLVTTDLLARGIDMDNVRNVILYDLPYSSVDLLHRAGRTGRMGKRGRVFLFVDKKESRSWVKGLEKVVRRGMALA